MTNAFLVVTAEAARIPLEAVLIPKVDTSFMNMEINDPIPWESYILMALWLVAVIVIIHAIIAGIMKKRKDQSTAGLSRKCLWVSTLVLFMGSGIIIWGLAAALFNVFTVFDTSKALMPVVFEVAFILYFLAINTILAGIGFVVAILLKDKESGKYKMLEEQ